MVDSQIGALIGEYKIPGEDEIIREASTQVRDLRQEPWLFERSLRSHRP
jgi:hypothetical protein